MCLSSDVGGPASAEFVRDTASALTVAARPPEHSIYEALDAGE